MDKEEKKLLPPYLSYKTFRSFIDGLKVTMPSRIDKSVMPSFSGTNQSWLISALKYLKLISEDGIPSPLLTRLAKANDSERKKVLANILQVGYPFLFDEPFDLKSATPRQIEDEFNKVLKSGETAKKSIGFFLAAAKDADIEVSHYLKKMRYTKTTKTTRRQHSENNRTDDGMEDSGSPDNWTSILMAKFPTLDPAWSDEVKSKWFDAFKEMMNTMKDKEEE